MVNRSFRNRIKSLSLRCVPFIACSRHGRCWSHSWWTETETEADMKVPSIGSAVKTNILAFIFGILGVVGCIGPTYDDLVAQDHPVFYAPLHGDAFLPNGDTAQTFNGVNQYVEFPDSDLLSVTQTGILSIEGWMRPDTLDFNRVEGSGYVYWAGKGSPNQYEYSLRMYTRINSENRPNRISGYIFNKVGGQGSGSYFQDPVTPGQWIHAVVVFNTTVRSPAYPIGYVKIYKNGVLRDQDSILDYNIRPENGTAPFRVGTCNFASYFLGAIAKVAIYDYELDPNRIHEHTVAGGLD